MNALVLYPYGTLFCGKACVLMYSVYTLRTQASSASSHFEILGYNRAFSKITGIDSLIHVGL